jgi:hypothetical protein
MSNDYSDEQIAEILKDAATAAGIPAMTPDEYSTERSLGIIREVRARSAVNGTADPHMDGHVSVIASKAMERLNNQGISADDIVATLLLVSAHLSSIAWVHEQNPFFLNLMAAVADDIDRAQHQPTPYLSAEHPDGQQCTRCRDAWPCRIAAGGR